jgi:hypothetical protein
LQRPAPRRPTQARQDAPEARPSARPRCGAPSTGRRRHPRQRVQIPDGSLAQARPSPFSQRAGPPPASMGH